MTTTSPGPADVKVSVAMITYNHEAFVAQAIESVLVQQTDFVVELVIGEDCSTDGTRDIVADYARKYPERIRPLLHDHNLGLMGKNNLVAVYQACRGEYIAFLEGDDYWTDPHKLHKQVDFLDDHPDYVLCFHDTMIINEHGNLLETSVLPATSKQDLPGDALIRASLIPTLTACFRNVLSFPPEYYKVLNADTFIYSMLGQHGGAGYLGNVIEPAAHRIHPGGIWGSLDDWNSDLVWTNTAYWFSKYYNRIGLTEYGDYYQARYRQLLMRMVTLFLEKDIRRRFVQIWSEFLSRRENVLDPAFVCRFVLLTVKCTALRIWPALSRRW